MEYFAFIKIKLKFIGYKYTFILTCVNRDDKYSTKISTISREDK